MAGNDRARLAGRMRSEDVSNTLKSPGADCPKCGASHPAEHRMAGQPMRWTCQCGASGEVTKPQTEMLPGAPAKPKTLPPPWARNLTKGMKP